MNKVEIAQAREKARKDGLQIEYWYAQTQVGVKILGGHQDMTIDVYRKVLDGEVKAPKLVTCPICEGEGHNGQYHCPVCDGTGICKKGNERRWQDWQIADMKARH